MVSLRWRTCGDPLDRGKARIALILTTLLLLLGVAPEVPQNLAVTRAFETPIVEAREIEWTPETLERLAYETAAAYELGNLTEDFVETLRKESMEFTEMGQSHVKDPSGRNGREESWGTCQINLPSHPAITEEEAVNPLFCMSWSANEFKHGRAWQWTEYRKLSQ